MNCLRAALLAVLFAGLAGCQPALVETTGPLTIKSFEVTQASGFVAATEIAAALERDVNGELAGLDPGGKPVTVKIVLKTMTYKNPGLSVLIGSANSLATDVTIYDASGKVIANFAFAEVRDEYVQGVLGGVLAAMQENEEVDRQIVADYTDNLGHRIYGQNLPIPTALAPRSQPPVQTAPKPAGAPVS